jgi:hypothetical protein
MLEWYGSGFQVLEKGGDRYAFSRRSVLVVERELLVWSKYDSQPLTSG